MTEELIAYAMYDMGDNNLWNEMAFRNNILADPKNQYKVDQVRINNLKYDQNKGELTLGLEKSNFGSNYAIRFCNETAIESFMHSSGVENAQDLKGMYLIGLFSSYNTVEWIIPYSRPITQDDINQTRIDANDFRHISAEDNRRLDDLLGE